MKRAPALVNFLLVVAIAATATYWGLQATSGRTPPEPLVAVASGDRVARTQPLDITSVAAMFGGADGPGAAPGRIRLTGVIAEGGSGRGVALLAVDGQPPIAYRAGEAIDAQTTLAAVHADRVVVRTPAGAQDLRLPERPAAGGIEPVR
jgi:general secretion pathway protein C